MAKAIDLVSQRFGRLVVIEPIGHMKGRRAWRCACDCGKHQIASTHDLRCGDTKSCGCLKRDATISRNIFRTTHGMSGTKVYGAWCGMMNRCYDKTKPQFKDYGGRGITVCQKWHDFSAFYADVGNPPGKKRDIQVSLDRPNNNQGYGPNNWRWATNRKVQNQNRRSVRFYLYQGQSLCLKEWSDRAKIPYRALLKRLKRGWHFEKAITTPPIPSGKYSRDRSY